MIFVHAIVRVKPEKTALYEEAFRALRARTLANEPGCPVFEAAVNPSDPCEYRVFEAYEDEDAIAQHISTDYYAPAAATFVECMEGDHMEEIERRGLTGRAMYDVIKSVKMERFETL